MRRNTRLFARVDYVRRHGRAVAPYLTLRRVWNLVLNEVEMRWAVAVPRSLPPMIKIEATPLCQLSCAGCWHHDKAFKADLDGSMQLTAERVRSIVEPVASQILGVSLSYSGEPLLNPRLDEVISYLHSRRISTSFPSNLSVRLKDQRIRSLVESGLDQILVSLDGASTETYAQYRLGGNFNLVVENVRRFQAVKEQLGVKRPYLIWKMVVFDHNRHEVPQVRRDWADWGFDGLELVDDHLDPARLKAQTEWRRALAAARKPCYWAWNTAVIGWDGGTEPCCMQINSIPLGNAATSGLRDVWRGEPYAALRRGFKKRSYGESMHPVCRDCLGLEPASSSAQGGGPVALGMPGVRVDADAERA